MNETAPQEGTRVSQGNDLLMSEGGSASQGEGVAPTCAGHIGGKSEKARTRVLGKTCVSDLVRGGRGGARVRLSSDSKRKS